MIEPLGASDWLFLASVAAFAGVTLASRRGTVGGSSFVTSLSAVGWSTFAVFWAGTAVGYAGHDRPFLVLVSTATAVLSAYAVTLALRCRPPHARLTAAFALMGVLFVPYQYLGPVYHAVLRAVTAHTVWGLGLVGLHPTVVVGVTGQPSALRFAAAPFVTYNIVSACTGISAIALFAGLVGVADAPPWRRLRVGLGVAAFVYCANVFRTVVVGAALGGGWFAFTAPLIEPLFGVHAPSLVSFYFAEYLLGQVGVVVVLTGLYLVLSARLPGIQGLLDALLSSLADDARGTWRALGLPATDD